MTWIFCTCGWVGIGSGLATVERMHHLRNGSCNPEKTKYFNQPHMSSDGVDRLLAEAKWGKS